MKPIEKIMRSSPVVPVLVIDDIDHAIPIAEALVSGGLKTLEVTLRTPVALDAIRAMAAIDGAIVGAGTVLNADHLEASLDAGSQFIVSPGLTQELGQAAIDSDTPILPGIASSGDIMLGLDMGLEHFKFFPAVANGGIPALKSIAGPFQDVKFCPTGGVKADTAADWLALDNVLCVGGTWLIGKGKPDQDAIYNAAKAASALAV